MSKQTRKKALALLLAAGLILSTAACGGNGGSSQTPSKAQSATTTSAGESSAASVASTAAEDGPLTPYAEPVKITTAVQASAVQQFIDGDTWENNVWTRKIKDDLNIDVEVAFSADTSTDAYRNKINALLASGDLPDVYRWNDRNFFKQAYDAGYLKDITSIFDQYGSEALKEYLIKYKDSFEGASFDGKIYGFPYMNDNFHQAAYLWIRDDWLANTNSQAPKTIDEMVALARKFTFEDPDKDGKNDTYGLALAKDVVQANYGTLLGLLGAYGVPGYTKEGIFYRGEDGKMTYAYLHPGVKDALTLVRDMYAEGLIDPEFVVKDVSNMETDIGEGKIGMMYHMNWGTWHPFNIIYQNSGVMTRPYAIPTVEGIKPQMGINSNKTGDIFMINSKCENPEALIKILNLYEKTVCSGTSEDFQTYWANEQYRFCPIFIGIPGEQYANEVLPALKAGSSEGLAGSALEYYNYVIDFDDGKGPKKDDTNAYGNWGQMKESGSMQLALEARERGELVTNVMASDIPEIWIQNSSVLGDMVISAFTDIITGTKPVESFDQFVKDWLSAGGQQTLDELDKLYPAK